MANPQTGVFPPSKRIGLVLHGLLIALLAGISAWGFWRLGGLDLGPVFVLYLVLGIVAFAPIPILGYRAYALYRALYRLDRDSLQLRWGLRDEIIPLADVQRWHARHAAGARLAVIDGATHFFHGKLTALADEVAAFARTDARLGL